MAGTLDWRKPRRAANPDVSGFSLGAEGCSFWVTSVLSTVTQCSFLGDFGAESGSRIIFIEKVVSVRVAKLHALSLWLSEGAGATGGNTPSNFTMSCQLWPRSALNPDRCDPFEGVAAGTCRTPRKKRVQYLILASWMSSFFSSNWFWTCSSFSAWCFPESNETALAGRNASGRLRSFTSLWHSATAAPQ